MQDMQKHTETTCWKLYKANIHLTSPKNLPSWLLETSQF